MTARWESAVEKQIREAAERGEFDNLPGAGKPLPDAGQPYHENWWVRGLLRREAVPDGPSLRAEVEALPARVARLKLESSVRDIVKDLNRRIREHAAGDVDPLDADAVVATWRAARGSHSG